MSFKLILVGAAALLAASPSFAATKHHHQRARHHAAGTEAVPEHSGPIPYAELAAVDAQMNRTGYDARPSHRHRRMHMHKTRMAASTPAKPGESAAPAAPAAPATPPPQ